MEGGGAESEYPCTRRLVRERVQTTGLYKGFFFFFFFLGGGLQKYRPSTKGVKVKEV